jgi:hypothetical protein
LKWNENTSKIINASFLQYILTTILATAELESES